ncbi:MAG: 1-phosphofructokinase [Agathobacter sp.]|nr:1-phosphofructokinase [Agathobacter sp.]
MIYTITFNPSLDYVVSVNEFEAGKINRTVTESIFAGGKGINVSIVLKELGVESVALGFVAGFTGQELQRKLQEQGLNTDFVEVQEGHTRINVKLRSDILIEPESDGIWHQETEVNGQGPVVSEVELKQLFQKVDGLSAEDVLVISGSVCRGVPQSIYADLVKLCNEKQIRVIVDASSVLLWNVLEHAPFLIKPNKDELEDLFYRDIETKEEVIFYAKELQNRGAKNVLVSLGKEGAVLVAENGVVYEMEAPKGEVINSVGAGDSMVAGFLAGYLQENNYEKALKIGICAGSATAFSEGLACKEDIDKFVRNK